jgi:ABC-type nickel/cobalt efflux system permease component RcnA
MRRRGNVHSGRWSLAGIGIAGGLVPSPSALVVLLAAIGLGRTGFGVLLVLFYGAGMAATLTGAGLLLLAVQRRLARATRTGTAAWANRLRSLTARLTAATPAATAALVLIVGAGLAMRAAASVI